MKRLTLTEDPVPVVAPSSRSRGAMMRRTTMSQLLHHGRTNHSALLGTLGAALEAAALSGRPYRVTMWPGKGAQVELLDDHTT